MTFRFIAALALALASTVASAQPKDLKTAIFAGGCFWCVESDFDKLPGVVSTTSGYTGGHVPHPTYHQVSAGDTGHAESVEIVYDPKVVSYGQLLDYYWHSIDPTVRNRQFCDVGTQYRTAIFYSNAEQKKIAEDSKAALVKNKPFKGKIVTEITPASAFYPAEAYHQNFHLTNPLRYKFYKSGCGRPARLRELWGPKAG